MTDFETRFPPASPEQITAFEAELGHPLPDDYRAFLQQVNGGIPTPGTFAIRWAGQPFAVQYDRSEAGFIYGLAGPDEELGLIWNHGSNEGRIPRTTLAVGEDGGGNLVLLGVAGGEAGRVFYWAREFEGPEGEEPTFDNVGYVADSFSAFLGALREA